ncbi:hypothetical protein Q31a_50550 [Aureliella helgolandensis]|uniref:Tll0287-like domain-containing protein n=2 Tax=Aureliella helgolandensis TaxID=2527968 RepID=A0A518GDQ0_9BACT|nr:hypothetical protein Q31a_50550 [Aureliella helgolandensis]
MKNHLPNLSIWLLSFATLTALMQFRYLRESPSTFTLPTQVAVQSELEVEVTKQRQSNTPATLTAARWRARALHEAFHGALQVMHRDFFDDETSHTIPSQSLEDVFEELANSYDVRLRWLAVNADALNADHKPQNEFEQAAVRALAKGLPEYEALTATHFQFAGAVRLSSTCLKCHVPRRTSTEDRIAGLVITMPIPEDLSPPHSSKTRD